MIDKNPQTIKRMFNKISEDYDNYNNIISFFSHKLVKKFAVKTLNIKPHSKILDLCCGSGDFGRIVKKLSPDSEVIGIDFSTEMLNIARKQNSDIFYLEADATQIPFEDNTFDYVVMGFGLRNIENQDKALNEIFRILKPNGLFLHMDFGRRTVISNFYDKILMLLIKLFFKNKDSYIYLINSKNIFPEPDELIKIFQNSGFECISKTKILFDIISFQILKKNI